jgi:CHAT domain-containing protein/Tfp pilus assembly protein PilF
VNKVRLILLLLAVLALSPVYARQGGDDRVLTRESDESAITAEEKQHALTVLLDAAGRLRGTAESVKAARFLNRSARLQFLLNQPQDALATYRNALAAHESAPDVPTDVDSLNGMGEVHTRLFKCDEAKEVLQRAVALSEQVGYVEGKAQALLTMSVCFEPNHNAGLRVAQESLALWQSVGRRWGIAKAYSEVGRFQLALNNVTEATQSQEAALAIWRELGLRDEEAEELIILGFAEYRKGAWQGVFSYLTQAQTLLDEKSDQDKLGQINAGLGEAFVEVGLPEAALYKFSQATEYYRQSHSTRGPVVMSMDIGTTYYAMGDYQRALAQLQQALADAESIKESSFAAMCHEFLGRTYAALNDRDAALGHYRAALEIYPKIGDRMEEARTLALVGQLYEQEGKLEKARGNYLRALGTFVALDDRLNESAALYALGSLEFKRNNLDAAQDYLRQSIDITEDVRRVSTSTDLVAAFSATISERYEKYVECLMRRHEAAPAEGFAARAFEMSELARARSLSELLRATQTELSQGIEPELAERERSLRQSLRVREDYKVSLLSRDYRKEDLDALGAEISRLEAEYGRVLESIRARHPSYAQMTQPAALGAREIQEQVVGDGETLLLEYILGDDRSYVWAVTRDEINSYELPARARIAGAAQSVYGLLTTPPGVEDSDELPLALRELSQLVLAPVASELKRRRVIIVADGALNYIPFQVLPSPADGGAPLITDCEVINAPSATILAELHREASRRSPAPKVLAAFGDPVFASNYALRGDHVADGESVAATELEEGRLISALRDTKLNGDSSNPSALRPLFYAKRELTNLRDVVSDEETFMAADFAATRERLLGADLSQYAILHFATHGLLDTKHPESSGLVLSTVGRDGRALNGFVGLRDIYSIHAPVDLVVLSACQTALGKDVRGEGLVGLTRGFMYAGASGVVASLWKVEDKATAELMKQFYANMLEKGMQPGAALREAQNSIRRNPRWSSPYYWAAFTLQGEYSQAIKHRPAARGPRLMVAGGAGLLTLLAVAFWWYRRRRPRAARSYSTLKK